MFHEQTRDYPASVYVCDCHLNSGSWQNNGLMWIKTQEKSIDVLNQYSGKKIFIAIIHGDDDLLQTP